VVSLWLEFMLPWLLTMPSIFSCAIGYLYICFEEMSVQIICLFLLGYLFLLLISNSSLYILDTSFLSDKWFSNVFSYSVGCLFTFFFFFCGTRVWTQSLTLARCSWSHSVSPALCYLFLR
jgi:hypothetical protein